MRESISTAIRCALRAFAADAKSVQAAADKLITALGYFTDRGGILHTAENFLRDFPDFSRYVGLRQRMRKKFCEHVRHVYLASQLAMQGAWPRRSVIFAVLHAKPRNYRRMEYAQMAHMLSWHLPPEASLIVFIFNGTTVHIATRHVSKLYVLPPSLGSIQCHEPHEVHMELLEQLSLPSLAPDVVFDHSTLNFIMEQWEKHLTIDLIMEMQFYNILIYAYRQGYITRIFVRDYLFDFTGAGTDEVIFNLLEEDGIPVYDDEPEFNPSAIRKINVPSLSESNYAQERVEIVLSHLGEKTYRVRNILASYSNETLKLARSTVKAIRSASEREAM